MNNSSIASTAQDIDNNDNNTQHNAGFQFIADLGHELTSGKLEIPAFPDVAMKIKSVLEKPEVTADQVARIVGSDPIFTARLLRVANSVAVNGAGSKINDVKMAVTRMGFKVAYNTAVSIAVEQLMAGKTSKALQPYLEALWHHSVQVAAYSFVIAKKQTRINPDMAMLAGLLHDIGKFYIYSRAEHYPELFNDKEALESIVEEWHTGIGKSILEEWDFSEEVCMAADEHEVLDRTQPSQADLTDIIMVANLFSHEEVDGDLPELEWDALPATVRLNLMQEDAAAVMEESAEEIRSIIDSLQH